MTARVFLVDYGAFIDNVSVRINLRKLPPHMWDRPKHKAFQVVVAGIR